MAEGGKSNTLIIVIIFGAVQMLLMAGFMFFMMQKINNVQPEDEQAANLNTQQQQQQQNYNNNSFVENRPTVNQQNNRSSRIPTFEMENKDYFKEFAIYNNAEFDNIAVNINNTEGHFLAIKMGLEYRQSDKKLTGEIDVKIQLIKNNIIEYLASIEMKDLQDIEYRQVLKDDIKQIVNNIVTNGQISRILFTQYVIQ